MYVIPSELMHGPFTVERSRQLGLPRGVLIRRFVRLHPRVWCHPAHPLSQDDRVLAATLARVLDTIKVGDWLLRHGHVTVESVRALALRELWRAGAQEAVWILERLDGRSRSLPESETRAILEFAGLPRPELNVALDDGPEPQVIVDLRYEWWGLVVEYEGSQHQEDRGQYIIDIGRYAWMRRHRVPYVQVTKEKLRHPRTLAGEVYAALVALGYDGPPPEFGERWMQLFGKISNALGPRRHRPALPAGRRAVS
jgi:hypothetical protein